MLVLLAIVVNGRHLGMRCATARLCHPCLNLAHAWVCGPMSFCPPVLNAMSYVWNAQVTETAAFTSDLGLDSLDSVELVMALEEEFAIEIPDQEADKITSVTEAVSYISANPMAK